MRREELRYLLRWFIGTRVRHRSPQPTSSRSTCHDVAAGVSPIVILNYLARDTTHGEPDANACSMPRCNLCSLEFPVAVV